MSMSLAIFKEPFSTSLVREGGDCFTEKPSIGRIAYGNRNHWSGSFPTSVRKKGIEGGPEGYA